MNAPGETTSRYRRWMVRPAMRLLRWMLSTALAVLSVVLILLGSSMFLIMVIDSTIYDNDPYLNWSFNIFLPIGLGISFFVAFLLVNLDRFGWSSSLRDRLRPRKGLSKTEDIDLD